MRDPRKPERLQWQSHGLVLTVVPACLIAAVGFSIRFWGPPVRNALLISLAIAVGAWLARAATPPAAVTGGILTAAMLLLNVAGGDGSLERSAFWPLLTLLLLTLMATRFGRRSKERLGIAEKRHGRNAAQVAANLGAAALAGSAVLLLSLRHPGMQAAAAFAFPSNTYGRFYSWETLSAIMLVAALAEATADTLSSELGEVLGGQPFLITTRQRVLPGTDGAVSLAGTLAGTMGACAVLLAAAATLGLRPRAAIAAGGGALGGLFFDSLLGATLERRGWLNNDAVNFLSTVAAALLALALFIC